MMGDMAKIMILIGIFCIVTGGLLLILGKLPWAGKLPGDIMIKRENFTFYFPLMTCIVISIILTLISYLWPRK
jgi:hypothetical protein